MSKHVEIDGLNFIFPIGQPLHKSRLFPQAVDPRTVTTLLRREVRAVDPHAICCGCGVLDANLPWTNKSS